MLRRLDSIRLGKLNNTNRDRIDSKESLTLNDSPKNEFSPSSSSRKKKKTAIFFRNNSIKNVKGLTDLENRSEVYNKVSSFYAFDQEMIDMPPFSALDQSNNSEVKRNSESSWSKISKSILSPFIPKIKTLQKYYFGDFISSQKEQKEPLVVKFKEKNRIQLNGIERLKIMSNLSLSETKTKSKSNSSIRKLDISFAKPVNKACATLKVKRPNSGSLEKRPNYQQDLESPTKKKTSFQYKNEDKSNNKEAVKLFLRRKSCECALCGALTEKQKKYDSLKQQEDSKTLNSGRTPLRVPKKKSLKNHRLSKKMTLNTSSPVKQNRKKKQNNDDNSSATSNRTGDMKTNILNLEPILKPRPSLLSRRTSSVNQNSDNENGEKNKTLPEENIDKDKKDLSKDNNLVQPIISSNKRLSFILEKIEKSQMTNFKSRKSTREFQSPDGILGSSDSKSISIQQKNGEKGASVLRSQTFRDADSIVVLRTDPDDRFDDKSLKMGANSERTSNFSDEELSSNNSGDLPEQSEINSRPKEIDSRISSFEHGIKRKNTDSLKTPIQIKPSKDKYDFEQGLESQGGENSDLSPKVFDRNPKRNMTETHSRSIWGDGTSTETRLIRGNSNKYENNENTQNNAKKEKEEAPSSPRRRRLQTKLTLLEKITENMEQKVLKISPIKLEGDKGETTPKINSLNQSLNNLIHLRLEPVSTSQHNPDSKGHHLKKLITTFFKVKSSKEKPPSSLEGLRYIKPYSNRSDLKTLKVINQSPTPLSSVNDKRSKLSLSVRDIEDSKLLRDRRLIKLLQVQQPDLYEKYFLKDLKEISDKLKHKQEGRKLMSTSLNTDIQAYYIKSKIK